MGLREQFDEELASIKKAKLTFFVGFITLAAAIGYAEYSLGFKEALSRKDDIIKDKTDTIDALKQKLSEATAKQTITTSQPTQRPNNPIPARVSGSATTSGDSSPANTGNGNVFDYGNAKKTQE